MRELCDPSGRILGYFTPAADRDLYATAEIPPIDEEELRRREHEEGGYTTAEVLDHLGEAIAGGERLMFSVLWDPRAWTNWHFCGPKPTASKAVHHRGGPRDRVDPPRSIPDSAGESRAERGRRVLFVPPLGITFNVQPLDRTVRILRVWRFRRRDAGA